MALSARVSVKLDPQALYGLLQSPAGPVAADIVRRSNRVLSDARRRCPVDEGRLRASLASEIRVEPGTIIGRVGTNVEYALYVHEGTGIYAGKGPITPKRARVLAWPVKNNTGRGRRRYRGGATAQYAYAKSVKGQPGKPFLRDALPAAR